MVGFDLKKFKTEGIGDYLKPCLFTLSSMKYPTLQYLAHAVKFTPGEELRFSLYENEFMVSYLTLQDMQRSPPIITLNLFKSNGAQAMAFVLPIKKLSFSIDLDWSDTNNLARWNVVAKLSEE